jgi:hypothetical protein
MFENGCPVQITILDLTLSQSEYFLIGTYQDKKIYKLYPFIFTLELFMPQ